jgi:hypothetical protein
VQHSLRAANKTVNWMRRERKSERLRAPLRTLQILTLTAFLFQVVNAVMTIMLIKAITREKEELTGYKE